MVHRHRYKTQMLKYKHKTDSGTIQNLNLL